MTRMDFQVLAVYAIVALAVAALVRRARGLARAGGLETDGGSPTEACARCCGKHDEA
jgi:hypothetical protein